ncbi:MAG: hypothetical protein WBC05_01690 [Sedimentisphaerales bacterium]
MPKRRRPLHEANPLLLPGDVTGTRCILQHGCSSLEKNTLSGPRWL